MSVKIGSWTVTPSIVVEDVDRRQSKLDYLKYPDKNANVEFPKVGRGSFELKTPVTSTVLSTIEPEVDGYVTPLSLCHACSPAEGSSSITKFTSEKRSATAAPSIMASHSETSFTSVDIASYHQEVNLSHRSANSQLSNGCFNMKTGLCCAGGLAQAIASGPSTTGASDHRVDVDFNESCPLPTRETSTKSSFKRRLSRLSLIGIVFLLVIIIVVIAVGIALYIQFVVFKPVGVENALNGTTICDLIVDGCRNVTEVAPSVNITGNWSNESGPVKATFSSSFVTQLNQNLLKTSS